MQILIYIVITFVASNSCEKKGDIRLKRVALSYQMFKRYNDKIVINMYSATKTWGSVLWEKKKSVKAWSLITLTWKVLFFLYHRNANDYNLLFITEQRRLLWKSIISYI